MKTFEKTFQLPSSGYFGGPKEITLRAMTTKEEKILLTSRDFTLFERLVKSCCVEPKDLDLSLLHQNDIMYLIYALRQITFGDTYIQESACTECGYKQQIEVDIQEMNVDYLDIENLDEKLTVDLPVCGDKLELELISYGANEKLDKLVKSKTAKGRLQDPDAYRFTLGLMELIKTRNGEEFTDKEEKRNYVDSLHMKDLVVIQNCMKNIKFGLDNSITRVCEHCGEEFEVSGVICPEFFRPSV